MALYRYSIIILLLVSTILYGDTTVVNQPYTLNQCMGILSGSCYRWEILEQPKGSDLTIPDDQCLITFTPQQAGTYRLVLRSFDDVCDQEIKKLRDQRESVITVLQDSAEATSNITFLSTTGAQYRGEFNYYCSDPGTYSVQIDQRMVISKENLILDPDIGSTEHAVTVEYQGEQVPGVWSIYFQDDHILSQINLKSVPDGQKLSFTPLKHLKIFKNFNTLPGIIFEDGVDSDQTITYPAIGLYTVSWVPKDGIDLKFYGNNLIDCPTAGRCVYERLVNGEAGSIVLPRGDYSVTYQQKDHIAQSKNISLSQNSTLTVPDLTEIEKVIVTIDPSVLRTTFYGADKTVSTTGHSIALVPGIYSVLMETSNGIDRRVDLIIDETTVLTPLQQRVTIHCVDLRSIPLEGFIKLGERFIYCDPAGVTVDLPASESVCH